MKRHITEMQKPTMQRPRRLRLFWRLLLLFAALVLLAATWALAVEPGLIAVRRISLFDPNLPLAWDGRTIAFFTDIHAGPSYSNRRVSRLAKRIRDSQPDLVLFGGDLIDNRTPTDTGYTQELAAALAQIEAPQGCFAILGNHDNRLAAERRMCRRILEEAGFRLLVNESAVLDGLWLGGLDESYFGNPDLEKTFSAAKALAADPAFDPDAAWRLLLMHQPDYAASLNAADVRLILAGHSHNGQITFFGLPLVTVHQGRHYPYGIYQLGGGRQMAVSRGLGTVGIPARFFAAPEVMLITLRKG